MTYLSDVCNNIEIKVLEFFFQAPFKHRAFFVLENVNVVNQSIQTEHLFDLQNTFIQWNQEIQKPKFLWKIKDAY